MGAEYFAGLDLGGTYLKYAVGKADGKILKKGKLPSRADESQDIVFSVMFEALRECQKEAEKQGGTLKAVGVGSPGAIDFDTGCLIGSTPNIKNWANADIRGTIEAETGLPVWAENDANIMAFAESRQGAAQGYNNVICTTLGTGIGGGILIDGEIYRGSNFAGAEIGHMMIVHDGLPCNCGGHGCFEKYASATAMIRQYVELLTESGKSIPNHVSAKIIFENADRGEKEADKTIEITLAYMGTGFASLINIFNPEILVVGGGVAGAGNSFITRIQRAIEERAMKPALKNFKVIKAKLGNDAGFVGGISLAAEMLHKSN